MWASLGGVNRRKHFTAINWKIYQKKGKLQKSSAAESEANGGAIQAKELYIYVF